MAVLIERSDRQIETLILPVLTIDGAEHILNTSSSHMAQFVLQWLHKQVANLCGSNSIEPPTELKPIPIHENEHTDRIIQHMKASIEPQYDIIPPPYSTASSLQQQHIPYTVLIPQQQPQHNTTNDNKNIQQPSSQIRLLSVPITSPVPVSPDMSQSNTTDPNASTSTNTNATAATTRQPIQPIWAPYPQYIHPAAHHQIASSPQPYIHATTTAPQHQAYLSTGQLFVQPPHHHQQYMYRQFAPQYTTQPLFIQPAPHTHAHTQPSPQPIQPISYISPQQQSLSQQSQLQQTSSTGTKQS